MDILLIVLARLFQIQPKVESKNGKLVAASDWRSQLISLGFGSRRLEVDPRAKVMRFWVRSWWFVTRVKRIEFDWVDAVLYGYSDLGGGEWSTHRSIDLFTVGLRLKNREIVKLFRFCGQGSFVNASAFPDEFYWQEFAIDPLVHGNQETGSLTLAEALSRVIGVEIVDFYGVHD